MVWNKTYSMPLLSRSEEGWRTPRIISQQCNLSMVVSVEFLGCSVSFYLYAISLSIMWPPESPFSYLLPGFVSLWACANWCLAKSLKCPLCIFLELLAFGILGPPPPFCCIPQLYSLLSLLSKAYSSLMCYSLLSASREKDREKFMKCSFVCFPLLRDHNPALPIVQHLKPFVSNVFFFYSFILHCLCRAG